MKKHVEKLERTPHFPNDIVMLHIKEDVRAAKHLAHDTLRIGLDISVDCTGVACVIGNQCALAQFVPNMPPANDASDSVNYIQYNKSYNMRTYASREFSKMLTMRTLANKVRDFIEMFLQQLWPVQPKYVQIAVEGAAFGYMQRNTNSLVELTMYRAVMQDTVYHMFDLGTLMSFDVIAPKSLKKEFTGDGSADKIKMIETAIEQYDDFHWCGIVDGGVDAYALATSQSLSNPEPRLW